MTILCTIDLLTREVFLPADQRIAAYDHNVDVIHFQAEPVEDFSFDLSSIRIAAKGPNKARHDYPVDPSTVSIEEETGYITFDWPIPQGVTEMPEDTFGYGATGQLIFAVCAEIISGSTLSKAWHSDDGIITVVAHLEPEAGGGEDPEEEATNRQMIGQLQTDVAVMRRQIGAVAGGVPTVVDSVSDMTDTGLIYILSTDGKWYYHDGTTWTAGGTYGGAVTDTTLSISGTPADSKAVGDALAEKADADDVTALETAVAEKADTADVANLDNRVTAIESNSGSDYKTPDKSKWTFSLSADDSRITVLSNNRVSTKGDQSVNGYTTYLVPNEVIADKGVFMPVAGTRYFTGYYLQTGVSRTYQVYATILSADSDYTGLVICMQDSKGSLDDNVFMNKVEIITTRKSKIDIAGFCGYETDRYLTFSRIGTSGYNIECSIKVETDKVYVIDFTGIDAVTPFVVRSYNAPPSGFSVSSQAKYAIFGQYYMIPSIDGFVTFQLRVDNANPVTMYNSDGIKLYVLDKPWEIKSACSTVPCRPMVHAGNFKQHVLMAYALGWGGVETDVRCTSDGVYVFSHDNILNGVTIEESTFAQLKNAYPSVMTLEESVGFAAYFGGWIDFHFASLTADQRWEVLKEGIQRRIERVGYYTGIPGNIGAEPANTFFNHGLVYGYADGMDNPDSIGATKYLHGLASQDYETYPQNKYLLPIGDTGSGIVLTNEYLWTTLRDRILTISYFSKCYPLYDVNCRHLSLDTNSLIITSAGAKKIYPTPDPINCSKKIVWSSSDETVATVSASESIYTLYPYANITPVGNGTCTITATIGDVSASCEVTVSIA